MRHVLALLTLVLGVTLLAAAPASAAASVPVENRASGFAAAFDNLVSPDPQLSAETVRKNADLGYDFASGSPVAAKSAKNAAGDVARARKPSSEVRRQSDAAATDAEGKLRCQYCGQELTTKPGAPNSREFDHEVPYSRGGTSDIGNIKDACRTCNRSKGAKTPEEWGGP
jgi:hypothetical protein